MRKDHTSPLVWDVNLLRKDPPQKLYEKFVPAPQFVPTAHPVDFEFKVLSDCCSRSLFRKIFRTRHLVTWIITAMLLASVLVFLVQYAIPLVNKANAIADLATELSEKARITLDSVVQIGRQGMQNVSLAADEVIGFVEIGTNSMNEVEKASKATVDLVLRSKTVLNDIDTTNQASINLVQTIHPVVQNLGTSVTTISQRSNTILNDINMTNRQIQENMFALYTKSDSMLNALNETAQELSVELLQTLQNVSVVTGEILSLTQRLDIVATDLNETNIDIRNEFNLTEKPNSEDIDADSIAEQISVP